MNTEEMINYWKRSAAEDLITAESMFKTKRYLPCLFYSHLFIEKIIKAIVVKNTNEPAPYGHKLRRLTELAGLKTSEEQSALLDDLTSFNINARYEDYKFSLYKKATEEYTLKYLNEAKELYQWLTT